MTFCTEYILTTQYQSLDTCAYPYELLTTSRERDERRDLRHGSPVVDPVHRAAGLTASGHSLLTGEVVVEA